MPVVVEREGETLTYEVGDRGPLVAVVDYGLKTNIIRSLRMRGARVRVLPHTVTADQVRAWALALEMSYSVIAGGAIGYVLDRFVFGTNVEVNGVSTFAGFDIADGDLKFICGCKAIGP